MNSNIGVLDCGHPPTASVFDTGYGIDGDGKKLCYECCARRDEESLQAGQPTLLYLRFDDHGGQLVNWPGTLSIPCRYARGKAQYNSQGERYSSVTVWMTYAGREWWGRIGSLRSGNSVVLHPKAAKK